MNKTLIERQFAKSLNTYNAFAIVQQKIIHHFFELIAPYLPQKNDTVLEIGTGTGMATEKIEHFFDYQSLDLNDFPLVLNSLFDNFTSNKPEAIQFLSGDIEILALNRSYDLIISTSTEQWIVDKRAFYQKIQKALKPNAFFAFTGFGNDNLKEIYKSTGTKLNYLSFQEQQDLLSRYFKLIYAEEASIELYFSSVKELVEHLKYTGVNGIENRSWRRKEVLEMFKQIENYTFVEDNKYKLSYHPFYFILQKQ